MPEQPDKSPKRQPHSNNPIPSRESILAALGEARKPLSEHKLATILELLPEHKRAFSFRLKAMVRDGQLLCNRRKKFGSIANMHQLYGRVIGHADGFGYLQTSAKRYFISHLEMRKVLPGDQVLAFELNNARGGKPEVAISEVLKHNTTQVIGRLFREGNVAFVQSVNKRIAANIVVLNPPKISADSLVNVKLIHQPTSKSLPIGEVTEVIRPQKRKSLEVDITIRSLQIPYQWSQSQLNQAARFSPTINRQALSKAIKAGREDLRNLPLFTVDGKDSKDFDDAVYCHQQDNHWRLIVAIADVANYVKPNTSLDKEAQKRGNSVYFPNRVIPMLPESLSNGICSLNPKQDRFCLGLEMIISKQGELIRARFFEGLIRSVLRLTYKQLDILQRRKKSKHWDTVPLDMYQPIEDILGLYNSLKHNRKSRGSIEIDTPMTEFSLKKSGKIRKIKSKKRLRTHKIIEECMLLANVCASQFLSQNQSTFLHRVHDTPKTENIKALSELLHSLNINHQFSNPPLTKEISKLLLEVRKHPLGKLISIATLRSLKQAVYSTDNIGHFGLNYPQYTHFTSPIRRYSDLLVHRQIKAILQQAKPLPVNKHELEKIAEHLSYTERRADEASREVISALKCEYALQYQGQILGGSITSVTSFGMFVDVDDILIEGLVHISHLGDEYFHFDPVHHRLLGESSHKSYQLGDRLEVRIHHIDVAERRIDLRIATPVDNQSQVSQTRLSKTQPLNSQPATSSHSYGA